MPLQQQKAQKLGGLFNAEPEWVATNHITGVIDVYTINLKLMHWSIKFWQIIDLLLLDSKTGSTRKT
jgi:hypothetical protein